MTNKEAIRILGLECDEWDISHCTASERREAFGMAITALQELDENPTKLNNSNNNSNNSIKNCVKGMTACRVPEDDCISRQAAINVTWEEPTYTDPLNVLTEVRDRIKALPSVQPETCDTCKHGYFGDEQCSSCRVRFTSHYERRNDD